MGGLMNVDRTGRSRRVRAGRGRGCLLPHRPRIRLRAVVRTDPRARRSRGPCERGAGRRRDRRALPGRRRARGARAPRARMCHRRRTLAALERRAARHRPARRLLPAVLVRRRARRRAARRPRPATHDRAHRTARPHRRLRRGRRRCTRASRRSSTRHLLRHRQDLLESRCSRCSSSDSRTHPGSYKRRDAPAERMRRRFELATAGNRSVGGRRADQRSLHRRSRAPRHGTRVRRSVLGVGKE